MIFFLFITRSGFFFICGIFVYGLTWILLGRAEGADVDPSLAPQFKVSFFFMNFFCTGSHAQIFKLEKKGV